ncbi:ATP-binding cassette domain-containing protein [Streptomyces sp. NBC_00988]|uniref:ATP-binding cassette domain-containing protein n=1 Tax=Streptomyces sp. NBC_00988 TaxID=2903704 RepID=UPI003863F7AC|nr:ATP-binding cassette domain-containing protein [Streptomyces sp. NBC_00988]
MTTKDTTPLLQVEDLEVRYRTTRMRKQQANTIDGVSFSIRAGETLALVGESGSGKSTIGKAVLGIAPVTGGRILLGGQDISRITKADRKSLATQVQMVFQNPYGSLNPSLTIGDTLSEPLRVQRRLSRAEADERTTALLDAVGLPPDAARRYPAQFSGGQRQRIAVARAMSIEPELVVCDEPTSALDVSTQAGVLKLLGELREKLSLSYLFITHDLALVRTFADRVIVLNNGRIVEEGTAQGICEDPQHPYTQRLVAAAPIPHPQLQAVRRAAHRALLAAADG